MFQIFELSQSELCCFFERKVLECFESWHLLHTYIERVIPMNFMCINSDQTEKKAYKVCQSAKFGFSLHISHKVWMMNYKVWMLNARGGGGGGGYVLLGLVHHPHKSLLKSTLNEDKVLGNFDTLYLEIKLHF